MGKSLSMKQGHFSSKKVFTASKYMLHSLQPDFIPKDKYDILVM